MTEKLKWRPTLRAGGLGDEIEFEIRTEDLDELRRFKAAIVAMPPGPERAAAMGELRLLIDVFAIFPGTTMAPVKEAAGVRQESRVAGDGPGQTAMGSPPPAAEPFGQQIGKWGKDAPETSRQAAIDVYPRSGTQRHRLLQLVAAAGERGLTCDEAEASTGLPHQSASARWNELWHDYLLISPSGLERRTRNGSSAAVFTLTDHARALIARYESEEAA